MTAANGGRLNHVTNLHAGEWADCKICGSLRLTNKWPSPRKTSFGKSPEFSG